MVKLVEIDLFFYLPVDIMVLMLTHFRDVGFVANIA